MFSDAEETIWNCRDGSVGVVLNSDADADSVANADCCADYYSDPNSHSDPYAACDPIRLFADYA